MAAVLLDTTDLAEAEQALSANFTKVRIESSSRGTTTRTRLTRRLIGALRVDELRFDYDFRYETNPPDKVALLLVRSGLIRSQDSRGFSRDYGPGDVGAFGAVGGLPINGHAYRARYDVVLIDRSLFDRVAIRPADQGGGSVRLTGEAPLSPAANRHMATAIGYVTHGVAAQVDTPNSPLIGSAVEQYLATTMLAVFPNTALLEPTIEDHHDSTPALLRKAIAFIDENAHRDISVGDISESIYVSPRALQYMFSKHRESTPMEYLRRVRLNNAHLDLIAGNRSTTNVSQIAAKWGFSHPGRFAIHYRQNFGRSPHHTLRE